MNLYRAYAKVNIFLKITGVRDNYHEIISRFMRVESLFDELSFVKKDDSYSLDKFDIIGEFSCETSQNTLYKAYIALYKATQSEALKKLMRDYSIKVDKSITAFAGLGGGSSDAATYLKMCNEFLDLGLSLDELATIGLEVGADVPFFVYGFDSANVSGIGEVVEEFKEPLLDFEVFTPEVQISTPKVYKTYREHFFSPIDELEAKRLKNSSSKEILKSMNAYDANDLFKPAMQEYKELEKHYENGWHFSGSGSSFFKIKEEV